MNQGILVLDHLAAGHRRHPAKRMAMLLEAALVAGVDLIAVAVALGIVLAL